MRIAVAGYGLGLLLMLALSSACSSIVPATVTWGPVAAISGEPTITLTSRAQYDRVAQSITDAGLLIATGGSRADYVVQVKVGSTRSSRDCGTLNNLAYIRQPREAGGEEEAVEDSGKMTIQPRAYSRRGECSRPAPGCR